MNVKKRCIQDLISPVIFLQALRRIKLNLSVILFKLRPIIDQTGTYNYKDLKVVAKYLGSLAKTNIQKEMLQISQIYSKHHIL